MPNWGSENPFTFPAISLDWVTMTPRRASNSSRPPRSAWFSLLFTPRYPLWYNIEPISIPEDYDLSFTVLVYCGTVLIVAFHIER